MTTLLLYGEHDIRLPMQVARDLHEQIRGSRLVLVPGSGHGVNQEAPEQFNTASWSSSDPRRGDDPERDGRGDRRRTVIDS